jgi:hypothetical protein
MSYFIEPKAGLEIWQPRKDAAAQHCGATSWPEPWDQDAFVASNEARLREFVASDPDHIEARAKAAAKATEAAKQAAEMEATIERITGGLDRESVMAMARRKLPDARGYWPTIAGDSLIVRDTCEQMLVWGAGDDGWNGPVSTQGSAPDAGAGYGANE